MACFCHYTNLWEKLLACRTFINLKLGKVIIILEFKKSFVAIEMCLEKTSPFALYHEGSLLNMFVTASTVHICLCRSSAILAYLQYTVQSVMIFMSLYDARWLYMTLCAASQNIHTQCSNINAKSGIPSPYIARKFGGELKLHDFAICPKVCSYQVWSTKIFIACKWEYIVERTHSWNFEYSSLKIGWGSLLIIMTIVNFFIPHELS